MSNEPMLKVVHFSVGSAATNTHMSIDVRLDDPEFDDIISKTLEKWMKTKIAREQYDSRWK